jgi:hypothetical protein
MDVEKEAVEGGEEEGEREREREGEREGGDGQEGDGETPFSLEIALESFDNGQFFQGIYSDWPGGSSGTDVALSSIGKG